MDERKMKPAIYLRRLQLLAITSILSVLLLKAIESLQDSKFRIAKSPNPKAS